MAVSRSYAQGRNEAIGEKMLEHVLTEEEDSAVQEISDELLDVLDGAPTREAIMALTFVLCESICNTAPSLGAAMNASTAISLSLIQSISAYNKAGICRWNEEHTVQ